MKLMVIGANGLVGQNIQKLSFELGFETLSYVNSSARLDCKIMNILDFESSQKEVLSSRPDLIILCANMAGGVNLCETEKQKAYHFHFDATKNLALAAKEVSAKFVFISTDYVFSDNEKPVFEESQPNPLNYYGEVKLAIENWLLNNIPDVLIVRTTNVYGWDPKTKTPNYFMQVYNKLCRGENLVAANYLYGNPTYAPDLAKGILELLSKKQSGLFHVVGPDNINRYNWASRIKDFFHLEGSVTPDNDSGKAELVKRPKRIELSAQKFLKVTDMKMKTIEQACLHIQKQQKN